ncbi:2OG-Fe(II) oxygenase [Allofrancisella guangzhouensis]|uniref:Oxidoreductase n=1 Tax=Allofrancisella guangzhouensis TaxID=594679 RepID=A0A0A8E511_9GAMM|nr:2OG-Fe(II) oxygenase [Allofrancisella guangzhouensis]AJC48677.1 oxidoreductase [Allofrancisella guangzhouensis]MBK2027478.1 2OG-Fe(II) oxygenase [Allofrancisella guangzhouensis]MBK2044508.1 2OG-Fe(II) oxygenase [Allofrancisella guangzhouensis]MBK2045399.1 2OG-Fe(II) oxygenase [Allofrancisella guangzhouensis]
MSNLLPTNPLFEKIITNFFNNGYCVIDNWLSSNETSLLTAELAQLYQEDCFRKSAIGNKLNETVKRSIRSDFIYWLDETKHAQAFFQKVNNFIEYINKTCFAGIVTKEFHYAIYPKGAFYKKHIDTFQNDDRRSISIVCYLNDAWQESYGGELKLYLPDENLNIYPACGKIVIFNSKKIQHEVKTILSEVKRLSITGWLKTS